jgi:hypothetical protein
MDWQVEISSFAPASLEAAIDSAIEQRGETPDQQSGESST